MFSQVKMEEDDAKSHGGYDQYIKKENIDTGRPLLRVGGKKNILRIFNPSRLPENAKP